MKIKYIHIILLLTLSAMFVCPVYTLAVQDRIGGTVEFDSMRGFDDAEYGSDETEDETFGVGLSAGYQMDDFGDLKADYNYEENEAEETEKKSDKSSGTLGGYIDFDTAFVNEEDHNRELEEAIENELKNQAEQKKREANKNKFHSIRKEVQGVTPLT